MRFFTSFHYDQNDSRLGWYGLLGGFVLTLGVTLLAFEWSSKPAMVASLSDIQSQEVEEILLFAEEPAEFPGGDRALYKYIQDNVKYPVIAQENGVQGKVFVKFVVNEKGLVSNAEVVRGVDTNLDREALRVINSMPPFKPARQSGRFVKVYYNASINFQLQ